MNYTVKKIKNIATIQAANGTLLFAWMKIIETVNIENKLKNILKIIEKYIVLVM